MWASACTVCGGDAATAKTATNHGHNLTGSEPIIMCSPALVNFSLPSFAKHFAERNPLAGKGAELEPDRELSAEAAARAGVGAGPSEGEGWLSVENIDHLCGKCVGVKWFDRGGAQYVTTEVGTDPDELFQRGDCSAEADSRNIPSGWDFSGNGRCGKADNGNGYWRDCLIHDTCVWKNCHRNDAIPGGMVLMRLMGNDPSLDKDCGDEYDAAVDDWVTANVVSCEEASDCESGRCGWLHGRHCLPKLELGQPCHQHDDCLSGRCALLGFNRTCQSKITLADSDSFRPHASGDGTGAGAPDGTEAATDDNVDSVHVHTPWLISSLLWQLYHLPSTFKDAVAAYHRHRCIWHEDCADAWCSIFSLGFGGLWVDYLTCTPLKQVPEVCTEDAQCATGRCAGNPFVVSSHGLRCREKIPTWDGERAGAVEGLTGREGKQGEVGSLTATIQAAIHADDECAEGLVDDGVLFGCEEDSDCVSGRCAWDNTSSAVVSPLALHRRRLRCLPLLGADAPCEANSDCETGRCAMTAGWELRCLEKMQVYNKGTLQMIP